MFRRTRLRRHFRRRGATFGRRRRVVRKPAFRRRRVMRRPVVSRRRILQVSSEKKSDHMPPAVNTGGSTRLPGTTTIAGSTRSLFLCSARPIYATGAAKDHQRQSTDTFAKGYAETVLIDVENPQGWYWRRIVFSFYGDAFVGTGSAVTIPYYDDPTLGMTRLFNTLPILQLAAVQGVIYQGTQGVDWFDERAAKTDNRRIRVYSDKLRTLKATVTQSHMHHFKEYTPINQRLVYNDVETGKGESTNYVSVQDDRSCGDIYVYDYFFNTAGDTPQTVNLSFQGRYYWHER